MSEEQKHTDNEKFIRDLQEYLKVDVDGWVSDSKTSETRLALEKFLRGFVTLQDPTISPSSESLVELVDERSEKNIRSLHPKIQDDVRKLIAVIRRDIGDFRVTSGFRSYEEQNALYVQGRTKLGKVVTNARGGYSVHNFGLAFDLTLFNPVTGQPVWESDLYKKAGLVAEELGWDWAGGGVGENFNDIPHIEFKGATDNISRYRSLKAHGKDIF